MAKICEPFYGKKCEQFQGGRCFGDHYHLRYEVTGRNAQLGDLVGTQNFTTLGLGGDFEPIGGQIDCITEPFFPRGDDPFFVKYPVFNPFRTPLSVFIFHQGKTNPIQLTFDTFAFRQPYKAKLLEVFNFSRMGIDPCGSFDPDTKDKCKCTEGDQEIPCNKAKGGICCISKPKLTQLCRALR